jgi:(1->4)-alpha-D-glucan 1-alpha-D-glucosylmutase
LDSGLDWSALAKNWPDGRVKLALTRRLLRLRAELPGVFQDGRYEPIKTEGPHRRHVLAFARIHERDAVIVAVGRHFASLTGGGRQWPSARGWNADLILRGFEIVSDALASDCLLSSGPASAARLFRAIPVAVLRAILA